MQNNIVNQTKFILGHISIEKNISDYSVTHLFGVIFSDFEKSNKPMELLIPLIEHYSPEILSAFIKIAHSVDLWNGLTYHNSTHHAKVTYISILMGVYHNVSQHQLNTLIITASLHDYLYDLNKKKIEMEEFSISEAINHQLIPDEYKDDVFSLNQVTVFPDFRLKNRVSDNSISSILSDADICSSSAISFEQFNKETSFVEAENNIQLNDEQRLNFLKLIGPLRSMKNTVFEILQKEILFKQKQKMGFV